MSFIEQLPKPERYDYFLIWGHGLVYRDEIREMIRSTPGIEIVKILSHTPFSIAHLVKTVYSYDYAPFRHLKSKTRYLLTTPNEVLFIFVRNVGPEEMIRGKGRFRHVECARIKKLKEDIRNRFNLRKGDRRTEDHVVHASDNESQTDYILRYLGYENGVAHLRNAPSSILSYPHYIQQFSQFTLEQCPVSELVCSVLAKQGDETVLSQVPIESTPHVACLNGDAGAYERYVSTFFGDALTSDYSARKFIDMSKEFEYLAPPNDLSYVLTRRISDGKKLILDGLHRAAILVSSGKTAFPVAIVP